MIRMYLYAAAVVVVLAFAGTAYIRIGHDAVQSYKVEQMEAVQKKVQNANEADAAARACSLDPSCRLSNDGYRRD